MNTFLLSEAPSKIEIIGKFDNSCKIIFSNNALESIKKNSLKIKVNCKRSDIIISDLIITVGTLSGKINVVVAGNGVRVYLGDNTRGNFDFRMYRKSSSTIGRNTTSNGIVLHLKDCDFFCGEDCMFSSHILIQGSDQHGIVDVTSGEIINGGHNILELGDHVWLGRQCTLTPSASIGRGSIVATGAIVTKPFPEDVLIAGIPAKIIKNDCTWSRSSDHLDDYSRNIVNERSYESSSYPKPK